MPSAAPAGQSHARAASAPVALVCMPFANFRQPSLALGLLAAAVQPVAPVRTLHASLRFAEQIGAETYDLIATWRAEDLLGDWLFAHLLADGGDRAESATGYFEEVLAGGAPEHRVPYFGKPPLTPALRDALLEVRRRAAEFVAGIAAEVADAGPLVVGLTSMVHQQTASLALARRLRELLPATRILLGGPACHGEIGAALLALYPFLDAVATGEGEPALPRYVESVLQARPEDSVPGLLTRGGGAGRVPAPVDLDQAPAPDFSDYFSQLETSPLAGAFVPRLPVETSRGCWWGERCRCTFCGQASVSLTYRTKSPDRALSELLGVARRHPGLPVVITDEILPQSYFDDLLPRLPSEAPGLQVVYLQIRPDLSRAQLAVLAAAGVRRVEAGVESLSTPVLRLMRKGTTMLANVQFLKWARELGLDAVWNILWGLPGESPLEYQRMADLVPLLTHLQPPNTVGAFRLDRFSPIFEDPAAYGVRDVRPYPAWERVYGLPPERLAGLATSFAFEYERPQPVEVYTLPLATRIADWKEQHAASRLAFATEGERLVIFEGRAGFDSDEVTVLDGGHRLLYAACSGARTVQGLAGELSAATGRAVTAGDVAELLEPLVEQGLMLREGDRYLALALALPDADRS